MCGYPLLLYILNIPFNNQLPLAKLHWIVSDENESITVESVKEGRLS